MNTWIPDVVGLLLLIVLWFAVYAISRRGTAGEMPPDVRPGDEPGFAQRVRRYYPDLIRQAGLRREWALFPFWAFKILLMLLFPLFTMEMLQYAWFEVGVYALPVVLGLLGFVLPDFILMSMRRQRQYKIRRDLSYFVDLVVSLLHSGLSLERALVIAARDGFSEPHPIAEEVLNMAREMDLGKERSRAFFELADRTGVYEIRSIAGGLRIGFETGVGVVDILSTQADILRERHRARAVRRISTSTVTATVPVFLCGMPVFLVIVYFPAVVQVMNVIKNHWSLIL